MEKLIPGEKPEPGVLREKYADVNPEDVNNFRIQAGLFVAERHLSKEEVEKINEDTNSPLVELAFQDGLKFTRMNFPSGSIMELYRDGKNFFRIAYSPKEKTLTTQRYSTP